MGWTPSLLLTLLAALLRVVPLLTLASLAARLLLIPMADGHPTVVVPSLARTQPRLTEVQPTMLVLLPSPSWRTSFHTERSCKFPTRSARQTPFRSTLTLMARQSTALMMISRRLSLRTSTLDLAIS